MQKHIPFPQDLFNALADEAIEDLCKTGLDHEEIFQILEEFLGPQFAQRFIEKSQPSHTQINKGAIDPDSI